MGSFKKGFKFTDTEENEVDIFTTEDCCHCQVRINNCCEILFEKSDLEEVIGRLTEMCKGMEIKV